MLENISTKLKNLFKNKKNSSSTKEINDLNNGLTIDDILRYKNLIPNLLDEFIDQCKLTTIRSNSFSSKKTKLSLSENKLIHSNSGLLFKIKKKIPKKANVRCSIGRHYFLGSISEESKNLTTKNVRRGSFEEKKENIIIKGKKKDPFEIRLQKIEKDSKSIKRKSKRKKTIDPQDTVEASSIQFEISAEEIEINDTKEKLEEYQEKMRKTQLRYYVFKKITNYKSSLRRYFQKYRTIVQLMESLEEKKEESKENELQIQNKKAKLLKNLLKNRTYKEYKELNKYLLRFYYNSKYAAGIANLNKILEKNENKENGIKKKDTSNIENLIEKEETKNNKNNIINNSNNSTNINAINNSNFLNITKGEIKKEEENKELSPEEIEKAKRKRNKELRDLFYNKVRERQKWLHDHFVKFYYKGLLWAMKTGNIRNNTSCPSVNETKTEATNSTINNSQINENKPSNDNNSYDNNLVNKNSSEIDTININNEIEKKEEKNKEKKKEEDKQNKKVAFNKIRDRSKGLRKLLSEKNKEKTNILRKYFFKFLSNGILLSLKKTTLKSSKTLTKIVGGPDNDRNSENENKEDENNWIIEEKKRRKMEEEQKKKELLEKKTKILIIIFNKKDQILCAKERCCLQKWNLRAKIIAIGDLTLGFKKSKKSKVKKKIKKKNGKNKEEKEKKE